MKRIVLSFILALTLVGFSSFAEDIRVSQWALQSFHSNFKTASDVKWTQVANYYKADFIFSGQYISAFYDAEGSLIAMTRNISSLQLPIALQAAVKNNYSNFWINDLFEVANEEGTTYYITLQCGDTKLILKSLSDSKWVGYKKQSQS
ncbi:MAG: hypothetical protein NVS1B13_18670 [Flavisolibacter sp.]